MTDRKIYLDNAATTIPRESVIKTVSEAMRESYNPSALYLDALKISNKISAAREVVKSALGARDGELIFTSGGTESNNMALTCSRKKKGSRVIIGEGEHDSVFKTASVLRDVEVVFAPIKPDGGVDEEKFKALLCDNVSFVSIMHVSNETGAVNDIEKLAKLTKRASKNAIFHSDGVQAFLKEDVDLAKLGVDLYSVSAHKVHGPKGIGALYIKRGTPIRPLLTGGGQEKGLRSGTESYPLIAGFCEAVKSFDPTEREQVANFKAELLEKLLDSVDGVRVISPASGVPNILTLAFEGVRGEVLLHSLEDYGILVGTGSACASHHESRFKRLFALEDGYVDGVIRMSFSIDNDMSEIDYIVSAISACVNKLRLDKRK